jgi:hypothetical protein
MTELGLTWEREQLNSRQYRHIQHLRPIAYLDGSAIRRIVSDWGDSGISARPHIVTHSQLMTSVGDDGMRRIHPTREADRYMEIGAPYVKISGTWRKVSFSNTVRTKNLLAWTRPQANLAIIHAGHYVKLALELKGGYVPEDGLVAFPVGLSGLTRSGAKILADGQTVALLRAPVAYDAANPDDTRPIGWQFTSLGGQPYLVMTLPSFAGMSRPVVDPTLTLDEGEAGANYDTYLSSSAATTNYGTAVNVTVRATRYTPLFRFDVSSVPAGSTCNSAALSLFLAQSNIGGYTMTVHQILSANSAWTEDGATWNTRDGSNAWAGSNGCSTSGTDYAATAIGSYTGDAADVYDTEYTWSLTPAAVATWFGASNSNYGIRLYKSDEFVSTHFRSSDWDQPAYRPKLVVVYTEGGGGETAALTLARTAAIAPTGKATAGVSLSIARQMTLGEAGGAAAGAVMSLAREATLADGGGAAAAGNLTLARQIALATVGQAQAAAGLALALQRALIVGGINVTSVTLDLGRIAGIAPSGSAASSAEVALARYLQMLLAGEGIAHAAVSLGRALELAALGSEPALTATLDLGRVVGLSLSAGATAEAALELARRQALDAVAVAVAAAGLSLSNVRSVVMRGLNLVVTVTLARTYVVEAESRVFTVPAEGRTYTVEAENRTYTVTD